MNILNLFRSAPVQKLSSYTSSEVSHHAKKFIAALKGVENAAEAKGQKTFKMYQKTEDYAKNLVKRAEKGNTQKTLRNVHKLREHSNNLFNVTSNPFNRSAISTANIARHNISEALLKNKLNLR